MLKKREPINKYEDLDYLSAIWILSCNDENPLITYKSINYRLGLQEDYPLKRFVLRHAELFRPGVLKSRLDEWKQKMLDGKSLPSWISDIENKIERDNTIKNLSKDDIFRCQFRTKDNAPKSDIKIIEWGLQHINRLRQARQDEIDRKYKYKSPLFVVFITALLTFTSTYFISYKTFNWNAEKERTRQINNDKKRVYAEIIGQKYLLRQLLISRFEALFYSDYHETKWKLNGYPNNSIDLQEAQRWMKESEKLVLEISKMNYDFYKTLGEIHYLYYGSTYVSDLVNKIYKLKYPEIIFPTAEINLTNIDSIKKNITIGIHEYFEKEFTTNVDSLISIISFEHD
ncbi:hypothetical protein JXQ31_13090 [candidate division KSB1 bacterium]|nr:hypothetical protein [candidate division KSB1 bacterium]